MAKNWFDENLPKIAILKKVLKLTNFAPKKLSYLPPFGHEIAKNGNTGINSCFFCENRIFDFSTTISYFCRQKRFKNTKNDLIWTEVKIWPRWWPQRNLVDLHRVQWWKVLSEICQRFRELMGKKQFLGWPHDLQPKWRLVKFWSNLVEFAQI